MHQGNCVRQEISVERGCTREDTSDTPGSGYGGTVVTSVMALMSLSVK